MNNTPVDSLKKPSNKKIYIIFGFVITVILIIVAVIIVITGNKTQDSNISSNIPSNTCPDSLDNKDGRVSALYNGKSYGLSQEEYQWIQTNCKKTEQPVLSNLGISLERYSDATGRAGSLIFNNQNLAQNWPGNKIFFEFGEKLPSGIVAPEFGYMQIDLDTDIIAMAPGRVVEIEEQPYSNDYALTILFNDNWALNYDHITQLTIAKGDTISAGQILGKPSTNKDGITGFIEIQIQEGDGRSQSISHCPTNLLNPDLKQKYSTILESIIEDWENLVGDTNLYKDSEQVAAGCVAKTV